jgi:hypothetical protein
MKGKPEEDKITFLVLAMLGAWRASKMFELRDTYRSVLAPGTGYRIASAGMYAFMCEAAEIANDYAWPDDLTGDLDW